MINFLIIFLIYLSAPAAKISSEYSQVYPNPGQLMVCSTSILFIYSAMLSAVRTSSLFYRVYDIIIIIIYYYYYYYLAEFLYKI